MYVFGLYDGHSDFCGVHTEAEETFDSPEITTEGRLCSL